MAKAINFETGKYVVAQKGKEVRAYHLDTFDPELHGKQLKEIDFKKMPKVETAADLDNLITVPGRVRSLIRSAINSRIIMGILSAYDPDSDDLGLPDDLTVKQVLNRKSDRNTFDEVTALEDLEKDKDKRVKDAAKLAAQKAEQIELRRIERDRQAILKRAEQKKNDAKVVANKPAKKATKSSDMEA